MDTAKVFWSGRHQTVRLPNGYRFESEEVRIRRKGNSIILEPIATDWSWLDELPEKLDEDFIQYACEKPDVYQRQTTVEQMFEQ